MWAWYYYGKFAYPAHPEVTTDFETAGVTLTIAYVLTSLPVWIFQSLIEYCDFRSVCCSMERLCPHFLLSNFPLRQVQTSFRRDNHGCQLTVSGSGGRSDRLSRRYLPTYAQCTTNTFLAPTHTQVHHLPPMSKGKQTCKSRRFASKSRNLAKE